jgi:FMN phosphatase YigB (HAD superfamily)
MLYDKTKCIVFDYANTLSSDLFFQACHTGYPAWRTLFEKHVFSDPRNLTDWCKGMLTRNDIARLISRHSGMPLATVLTEMNNSCKNLHFNPAVRQFAEAQRIVGRKTALVTINIDVFSDFIVPFYQLDGLFDVIVNSSDYGTDDKLVLWQIAFEQLGDGITYENSLLIDDSLKWTTAFENRGGNAYLFRNDREFETWLISMNPTLAAK